MAIEAGHDLLEVSENSARAIDLVEKAVKSGRIKQADLDQRVKRVLAAKYWLGLHQYRPVPMQNLATDLNSSAAKQLVQRLAVRRRVDQIALDARWRIDCPAHIWRNRPKMPQQLLDIAAHARLSIVRRRTKQMRVDPNM